MPTKIADEISARLSSVMYWIATQRKEIVLAKRMILFLLCLSVNSPAMKEIPAVANIEIDKKKPIKSAE